MGKEKLFHVGVKALIENRAGEVLLLKAPAWKKGKTTDHWDIPGGRIQEGSSAEGTLRRELQEEIGVKKAHSVKFFAATISNHEIPFENKILGLVLMVYKTSIPADSKIILSDEHISYEWVGKKEAAKRLANKYPPEFTSLL